MHLSSVLVLIICIEISVPVGGVSEDLVRFCKNDVKHYELSSSSCPQGIFLNAPQAVNAGTETEDWDCICAQGSWYVQSDFCTGPGLPKLFLYGNVTCFRPNQIFGRQTFGGLSYIGDYQRPLVDNPPLLLTSPTNGLLLHPHPEPTSKNFILNLHSVQGVFCDEKNAGQGLTVIRLNPLDDWALSRNDDQFALCLTSGFSKVGHEKRGIFGYNISLLCLKSEPNSVQAGGGTILRFVHGCEYEDGNEWVDVSPFGLEESVIPHVGMDSDEACGTCLGHGFGLEIEDCAPADLMDRTELEYSVDLQSWKIGLHLTNRLLKPEGVPIEEFDLVELKLLSKAAIIAYGACNMNAIPKEFYTYFLIMFEPLLGSAFRNYPPKTGLDKESLGWIQEALNRCQQRTVPYDFILEKTCPPSYKAFKHGGQEKRIQLPEKFAANPKEHDYLLEFVWKLSTFLVYHCYADFEAGPLYHYQLREQLEAILTEDLLLRWTNPSNSFRMYTHLFKNQFKLPAIFESFEYCVGAAHAASKYSPDIWLKKPIHTPNGIKFGARRRKREIQEMELDSYEKVPVNSTLQCIQRLDEFLAENQISTRNCS